MPYGYLGTEPNQKVKNAGVVDVNDVAKLQSLGQWGGSLELIETQTVSASSTIDFTTIHQDKYDVHKLYLDLTMTNGYVACRFYESGTLETTGVYEYAGWYNRSSNVHGSFRGSSQTTIYLTSHNVNGRCGSEVSFHKLGDSSHYSFNTAHTTFTNNESFNLIVGGNMTQASEVDGIRIFNTSSNNMTGKAFLYGVKQI